MKQEVFGMIGMGDGCSLCPQERLMLGGGRRLGASRRSLVPCTAWSSTCALQLVERELVDGAVSGSCTRPPLLRHQLHELRAPCCRRASVPQ